MQLKFEKWAYFPSAYFASELYIDIFGFVPLFLHLTRRCQLTGPFCSSLSSAAVSNPLFEQYNNDYTCFNDHLGTWS